MTVYSSILGTGAYLPDVCLDNAQLATRYGLDTSDEWIQTRTGIQQRHILPPEKTTADMAIIAAEHAIAASNMTQRSCIDMVIVATSTPDRCMPNTACVVQHALGLRSIPAFDVNVACSGFIYALSIADQYIRSGACRHVLVIGSDAFTRIVDWSDRSTCVLFGDGAGAVVLHTATQPGLIGTHLYANGQHGHLLKTTQLMGQTASSFSPVHVHMQGRALFKHAVVRLGTLLETTLQQHGFNQSDIHWLIPHQANLRIIKATADRLALPMKQVVVTIDQHANTVAASIPLAFDKAIKDGRIQRGQNVLLEAFGAGLTWGSVLLSY